MFKYAQPIFLKGKENEKNVTGFFAANFECEKDKTVILDIAASSVYRVTVNGDTVCDGRLKKVMSLYCFETMDITKHTSEGINQIVIECAGYGSEIDGEIQNNFVMAEITSDNKPLAATGCNFIGFLDAERVANTEIMPNGDYAESYNISGATMVKMNVDTVDIGRMRFKTILASYNYSYKNATKALEKGKFTPYDNAETRYPVVLEEGEYALFDMEETMEGFLRIAFKTLDKAVLRVSYGTEKEKCDGYVDFNVTDGEFDRESFHRVKARYIKVDAVKNKVAVHLIGMHTIKK